MVEPVMNISLNLAAGIGSPFARSFWRASCAARARMLVLPAAGDNHFLQKGAVLAVPRPMHREIECLRGSLWITHDGDPRDVILEKGEVYRPDRDARMLVQALAEAEFKFIQ
jgi:hypothetical protein